MITEIIFDVETKKLFSDLEERDPAGLGVSIVSLYKRTLDDRLEETTGNIMSFWEPELDTVWPLFTDVHRIIGFNTIKFDVPVLKPYAPQTLNINRLPHFDILAIVKETLGHYLSLNTLAVNTLGKGKTDSGTNAVEYFEKHDPESLSKLRTYCEADVLITRDLYDFGLKDRYLKYTDKWNSQKTVPVDFSYPRSVLDSTRQIGLF